MADIVLATLNARYTHCAFGLRYLKANLPAHLQPRCTILEFEISHRPVDVIETLLRHNPRIVGLGVYIWNTQPTRQLIAELKRIAPQIIIIVGGPEVSHEIEAQPIPQLADYVLPGEADQSFAQLCERLLAHESPEDDRKVNKLKNNDYPPTAAPSPLPSPGGRGGDSEPLSVSASFRPIIITGELPALQDLALPYDLYDDTDLKQRTVYVEASRGCPFSCEFCLSSLDVPVREVPLDRFLEAMQRLLDRGLRQFKFVDRTFNLNIKTSRAILAFFLERYEPGLFLHFEMIPDRLPTELRQIIAEFPPGALQFEVGVQTFNEQVAQRISRRQNALKVAENLQWLRAHTGVYVHADLIIGLPGEDLPSFAAGFDKLVALQPHEIQIELLKRLRGTPIARHDQTWGMVYSPDPPYEVLCTSAIDFPTMQRLRRFARSWDLLANSGNFVKTLPRFWSGEIAPSDHATNQGSPFHAMLHWSDWVFARLGRVHQISLTELVEQVFAYLTQVRGHEPGQVAIDVWDDYQRGGRSDIPRCLRPYLGNTPARRTAPRPTAALPRQARRMG